MKQRVDASGYVYGCFSAVGMVIITGKVAHIIDLKPGKGVEAHAEENPRRMIHGLGVLHMAEALYDIETVRMTIAARCFLNAYSRQVPQVVGKRVQPIFDPNEVYSGCCGAISVILCGLNTSGNGALRRDWATFRSSGTASR